MVGSLRELCVGWGKVGWGEWLILEGWYVVPDVPDAALTLSLTAPFFTLVSIAIVSSLNAVIGSESISFSTVSRDGQVRAVCG